MFCVQQVQFCRFDQADAPHMRRKILNMRGEGQGSEYMGGDQEGPNFSLALN